MGGVPTFRFGRRYDLPPSHLAVRSRRSAVGGNPASDFGQISVKFQTISAYVYCISNSYH